jgi:plastocyanin
MSKGTWIMAMFGFAFALLTINVIYTTSINNANITGNVISTIDNIFDVRIENFEYSPKVIEISVGETVIWDNFDEAEHTITSSEGDELNSDLLSTREIYTHTFNEKGEYEYYCKLHPYMKGTIIVK